jgi:hypothetical protein
MKFSRAGHKKHAFADQSGKGRSDRASPSEAQSGSTQGFGSVIWTVTANTVRLLANTGCALVAIYWLDLGAIGFFIAMTVGFCAYAALTAAAVFRVKEPAATHRWVSLSGSKHQEDLHMYPSRLLAALAATLVLHAPTQTTAQIACKPFLAFKEVRFSEPQNYLRKWTGVLNVDATRCAADSGLFEIKFVRLSEMGPDLLFTKRFTWRPGRLEVALDVWWDEAIQDYWIGEISPCRCAN